jgi:hypothetical protein
VVEVVDEARPGIELPHRGRQRLAAHALEPPTAHAVAEVVELAADVRAELHARSLDA